MAKRCATCSFNPTSMSDYCDKHRPTFGKPYSYKPIDTNDWRAGYWILDPNGVIICPIEDEGHAVVLVDHLNRKA